MSVTLIQEYEVTLHGGEKIVVYSAVDLKALWQDLRYCKAIRRTGRTGTGSDGLETRDGATQPDVFEPFPVVTSQTRLEDIDKILDRHKRKKS